MCYIYNQYIKDCQKVSRLLKEIFILHGKTDGLPQNLIKRFEKIESKKSSDSGVISIELAKELCRLSFEARRQVGVVINRLGSVEYVVIGTSDDIEIPLLSRFKLVPGSLRGLRFIRTSLNEKTIDEDDKTDISLLRLDSLTVINVSSEGLPRKMDTVHLLPPSSEEDFGYLEDKDAYNQKMDYRSFIEALEDEIISKTAALHETKQKDYAVLTGHFKSKETASFNLEELAELARSAGVGIAAEMPQIKHGAHPKYVVGPGRLKEAVIKALATGAEYLIYDNNLTPSQSRSIGVFTELKVIDRTQLILDIFAKRAKSGEGKLRVELAQLKYILPRLSLRDDSLSRLSGGIGGRGPGETKLEVDKRRVGDRITFLSEKLKKIEKGRDTQRVMRQKNDIPIVSIIGYTNAGKSTLINGLTNSDIYADDLLFATLDTSSKRIRFPRERDVIITDTVGFIRDLPKNLAGAFKSTLEELGEADLFLHVIDASDPYYLKRIKSVEDVVKEMDFSEKESIMVFNKTDKLSGEELAKFEEEYPKGIFVSALDRKTFGPLLDKIRYFFFKERPGQDVM